MRARRLALTVLVACSFASATAHAGALTNLGAIADGTGGVDGLAGVHDAPNAFVPEPSAGALGLVAAACVLAMRRGKA